jgi:hypothetical protein
MNTRAKTKVYTETEEKFFARTKNLYIKFEYAKKTKYNGELDSLEFYNVDFDPELQELVDETGPKVYRKFEYETTHAHKPFKHLWAIV